MVGNEAGEPLYRQGQEQVLPSGAVGLPQKHIFETTPRSLAALAGCSANIQGARLAREGTPTDATTPSPNKNGSLDGLPFCLRLTDDSRQTREHFLGFALLPRIALGHHLIEDVPSAVIVAHVDVGLGQVEFGGDFVSAREEIELII